MHKRATFSIIIFCIYFAAAVVSTGGVKAEESKIKKDEKEDILTIAFIPEKNAFDQKRRYEYITDYLSKKLDLTIKVEYLPDYNNILSAFYEGKVDAGFFGSFGFVLTNNIIHLLPIARPVWLDGSSTYKGYIFVRKDSGIKTIEDMKGKKLALVSRSTMAGYIFPLGYFLNHGVENIKEYFSKIYFAGSHDAAAWGVFIGEADVGGCKSHIYNGLAEEEPAFKEEMVVLAESLEVPSNSLAVRQDLDPDLIIKLKQLIVDMDKTEEGQNALKGFGAAKFINTFEKDYDPLVDMINELGIDLNTFNEYK